VARFPTLISPAQVAFDIAGLKYAVRGVETQIRFHGEIFEMEDQRNWSDASFKTYCRPLSRPVPYLLPAGHIIRQDIEIRLTGAAPRAARVSMDSHRSDLQLQASAECVPTIALAVDLNSIPGTGEALLARRLAPRILQLRIDPHSAAAVLASAKELAGDRDPQIELEIVVPTDCGLDQVLADVAQRCQRALLNAARVTALPEAYLYSYQPEGPWPEGPTPRDACIAARRWFPEAQIGGGVLTHFVELNRCRPDVSRCDYITHSSTAIVHAAADRLVIETLEGLAHVYASTRALLSGREYRLGLVSIGMRSNPYGVDVAPNPEQSRVPMARIDPRQRGLFAAAWALGAMAATIGQGVSSVALASAVGPFGLIYRRAAWPQPRYDERSKVYPAFHVIRALLQLAAAPRCSIRGLPVGVVGVAALSGEGGPLILANLGEASCRLHLPHRGAVRRLDEASFESAISDADWLCAAPAEHCAQVTLDPFNVAFVDLPEREI
jgi:hypothetical protein